MTIKPSHLSAAAGVFALAVLPLLPVPEFWITQANYIGMFALVALGLVLLTGVAGLTSFGQAAFVGVGAYATALLSTRYGLSPWLGLVAGLAITVVIAAVLGWITLRMSGHYLPLATIAWALSLNFTIANLEFLGKYDGLLGVPAISLFGVSLADGRAMYYLIWLCALLGALAVRNLLDSRPGRAIRALGGATVMAEAMGVSTYRYKVVIFLIAALLASVSGWLFAHVQRTVNPSPFGLKMGIEYLFMAVVGGASSVWGAFVGAGVFKIIEDQLKELLPRLLGSNGNFEIIVLGVVLVLMLKYAPKGLWPALQTALARHRPARARMRDWAQAPALPVRPKPAAGTVLLEVDGLRKQFGGLVAVNDVSFTLRAGEIMGLIGPNGAGKSTTFNLISGVMSASAGTLRFAGASISGLPSRRIARLGLSRTFQHVKMIPDMTVLENVALGGYLRSTSGTLRAMLRLDREDERRLFAEAERQLQRIGMQAHLHELAGNLALGPQRMMEIARALCSDPSLLLLDEPAAGLRHKEKQALAEVLRQLRSEGMSILLVEHDMDFVMGLTDRLVVMEFGTKLIEGTPAQVQASPEVRAAYLGTEH
ncbi:branched-chain amino acid ABC transporter ATP-binding protein/permease [Roseateles amylovorans]|uniref:Branched-chain amino acid ABC transporter ATP-binding protein/permease n=1 Tax=Roseateles amylovorans TaxID=2978473 RepID=A0ABY6B5Y8_9BURK|nr:branched-chain amino acid ABC transporter ATP-binding protein/permease [Roseateles amylovorans]UXH80778.1 branched-chain amino acid ABC transporter ATP-binding protein/permease [Roseateles amylovorans]